MGHLGALYLLFLLVTRYNLSYHKTIYYHLFLVLAENTLLKTAYHFLLLLVGFDTLPYQKDYDRYPILVGHHSTHVQLDDVSCSLDPVEDEGEFRQHDSVAMVMMKLAAQGFAKALKRYERGV